MLNFFKTSSKASFVILPPMELSKPLIVPSPNTTNIWIRMNNFYINFRMWTSFQHKFKQLSCIKTKLFESIKLYIKSIQKNQFEYQSIHTR